MYSLKVLFATKGVLQIGSTFKSWTHIYLILQSPIKTVLDYRSTHDAEPQEQCQVGQNHRDLLTF